jgi:four helix bundle protein
MQDYRKLDVWARAQELVLELYAATERVSARRYPGLISQLRRSASAIPANIAEGCGHHTQAEFARFLHIATASAHELSYHLMLTHDLGIFPGPVYARLDARTGQVKQMLSGLLRKVRAKPTRRDAGAAVT